VARVEWTERERREKGAGSAADVFKPEEGERVCVWHHGDRRRRGVGVDA
jgi:hypothetical protein